MEKIKDSQGNELVGVRIDNQTMLFVKPEDATENRAEKFRRDMRRSQLRALNLDRNSKIKYVE